MMKRERRRFPRFPSRLFVSFQKADQLEPMPGRGVAVDVSQMGLAIESEIELEQGVIYDCHVEMPFAMKARVVRRYSTGQIKRYGLEMVGQGIIDRFVMKRLLKGQKFSKKI